MFEYDHVVHLFALLYRFTFDVFIHIDESESSNSHCFLLGGVVFLGLIKKINWK